MVDVRDLPAIQESRITKCRGCDKHIIEKGLTFWLVAPVRAGLDAQGLKERVGLTSMLGGSHVLGSMFAGSPAAREIDRIKEFCVCEDCAMTVPLGMLALTGEDSDES